ncbi:MAG: peptide deformylase [Bacteroidales bacterium]|nr:peptide deformylase [Bacteroidales bacterium]
MRRIIDIFLAAGCLVAAVCCGGGGWTETEKLIIERPDSVMYVCTVPGDSAVLRAQSIDVGEDMLRSAELETLLSKLRKTVTDPSQDGVGIAAPQVGINRRIICVQRFDKEGEPFECYVNIRIDSLGGEIVRGREGCLSIPGMRGIVPRHSKICIRYADLEAARANYNACRSAGPAEVSETIEGFTAVIFQHECDHLDGILYTDRADSLFTAE